MLERYKLIHRDTGEIVTYCDDNTVVFGGPWGAYDEEGKPYYIWVENIPEPPTPEQIQKALTDAVQAFLDNKAKERNYDNILTACSYANSIDPIFQSEALACVAWRDNVWRTCYNILYEVTAGQRKIPTDEELLAELPELVWPE